MPTNLQSARTPAHFMGSKLHCCWFLGLTPQALRLRLLRRLKPTFGQSRVQGTRHNYRLPGQAVGPAGTFQVCNPTPTSRFFMNTPVSSSPSRYCDIVMKGGITSGVVYPAAVVELSKTYSFKNIGGTSAGAIAAAVTAAAEYGRQHGRGGFDEVASLPHALGNSTEFVTLTTVLIVSAATRNRNSLPFTDLGDRRQTFQVFPRSVRGSFFVLDSRAHWVPCPDCCWSTWPCARQVLLCECGVSCAAWFSLLLVSC